MDRAGITCAFTDKRVLETIKTLGIRLMRYKQIYEDNSRFLEGLLQVLLSLSNRSGFIYTGMECRL